MSNLLLPFPERPRPRPKKVPKRSQRHASSLSRLIRAANHFALLWRDGLTESEREDRRRTQERKQILAARMQNATSHREWEAAARQLDDLEGNNEWKLDNSTGDYRPDAIEARLRELDDVRIDCDISAMLHLVRTALDRDLGGMGNINLYRHAYTGTKRLIERYVESAVATVEALVDKSAYACPPHLEQRDLLSSALYARQSFGRSALLLSGGATFGMAHIGVLKAMFEAGVLPRIISGASAGSIVCSVLCTRTDEEIPAVMRDFPYGDLAVFDEGGDDEDNSMAGHLRRLLTEGSWSDIKHLTRVMRMVLGDITFQEAYNRTRRICNIPVSSPSVYELPRLLNYVTSPNVMIWSAVAASCSVPLVFNAAPLLVKDPDTGEHAPWNPSPLRYIDGSLDNDLPMSRLASMFNINHFIVSQVNPHVIPFLSNHDHLSPAHNVAGGPSLLQSSSSSLLDDSEWLPTLTKLAKDEVLHRLQFLSELGILPNLCTKLRSVLSQKYSGNITILPDISFHDLPRVLKNPDPDFMLRSCLAGERATWPKLSRIRDRCAIELALDRAVHVLRARVVFSESQVDLRRLVAGPGRGLGLSRVQPLVPSRGGGWPHENYPDASASFRCHRRGSGGSIQLLARQKRIQQGLESAITDVETEEEERVELSRNRSGGHTTPGAAQRSNATTSSTTPRLKRVAKSHYHLPMHAQASTSPVPSTSVEPDPESFDFAQPITPPRTSQSLDNGAGGSSSPDPPTSDEAELECIRSSESTPDGEVQKNKS